jgi:hypothetical protein
MPASGCRSTATAQIRGSRQPSVVRNAVRINNAPSLTPAVVLAVEPRPIARISATSVSDFSTKNVPSGALEGMAIARVLNALTTKSKVHTLITLVTHFGELYIHHGQQEPVLLRMSLSRFFVHWRRFDPQWLAGRLAHLASLRDSQGISSDEFALLKDRLMNASNRDGVGALPPLASQV